MDYIALPQPTLEWLTSNKEYKDALLADLSVLMGLSVLKDAVLAVGPFRVAGARQQPLLVAWNVEYLSATGAEEWGVIRMSQPFGFLDQDYVDGGTIFQTMLYVANQRLQDLLLPEAMIHRHIGENVHTCLAGKGSAARQCSMAYYDTQIAVGESKRPIVFCAGPSTGDHKSVLEDVKQLVSYVQSERHNVPRLLHAADKVLADAVQRPAIDSGIAVNLAASLKIASVANSQPDGPIATVPALSAESHDASTEQSESRTYDIWTSQPGLLTREQTHILNSDILLRQPLRIVGPAGSGKTLLMQLLAIRMLRLASDASAASRILYVVHNSAMKQTVEARFRALGADEFLAAGPRELQVRTLFEFSRQELSPEDIPIIDPDANETKRYQLIIISDALAQVLSQHASRLPDCPLFKQVANDANLMPIFAMLLSSEIGIAIKGHGLTDNPSKYIGSEQPLSRLHSVLNQTERQLAFEVFRLYHEQVYESAGLLDSDDLALTLLSRLRTPLWGLKRKQRGFDFLFVDETQLFNENERRLIPLLTKKDEGGLPIALALDEAQELRGAVSSGFGLLGLESIANEQLKTIYRSTEGILRLAFHLIQRTTDLFGVDFPNFTSDAISIVPDDHRLAEPPQLVVGGNPNSVGKYVVKHAERLRKRNLRQIGVVIHSDRYWDDVIHAFSSTQIRHTVLMRRGERLDAKAPIVAIGRPSLIGGQEFDAVIAVGLERGLVPPRVEGHEGLAATLEQQALREMYLSFTRARYRLVIVNAVQSTPSPLLKSAIDSGLIKQQTV